MRALWLSLLLSSVALAGCFSSGDGDDGADPTPDAGLDAGKVQVPGSAKLNETLSGLQLEWPAVSLPFSEQITIPEGATMVRFVADPGPGATVSVAMSHSDTGRRRCNQQTVVGFSQTLVGERSCSSLAAIDPPGTNWTVSANGATTADLRVEFYAAEPDGVAGLLNLSLLSHATHELEPTQYLEVPSFDGTVLWVEVTLPKGEGPWPTVIASSPYNGEQATANRGQQPAMWTYWTQDYAKRGYAAVNVDVRGYGMSGGCVEIWGINEQLDQKYIVEWATRQPWSDGNVGFYGQSYVGTTPVEAAVHQAEGLKAIIAVAPVINAYEDWHYGGVPNGESTGSPVAYQVLTAAPAPPSDPTQPTDLVSLLAHAGDGVCDPTIVGRANDPRAIYNEYYQERDFKLGAKDIKAAVLFTEGFEDANVKSAMIPGWFNDITAPKLGVFGHWLHQHPARMDAEVLFLGWMDQYVKGKPIGFENVPEALVSASDDWHRTADSWPTTAATQAEWGLDFTQSGLDPAGGGGSFALDLGPQTAAVTVGNTVAVLTGTVTDYMPIHAPRLRLAGEVTGENGFVYARLDEVYEDGGSRLLTWGMVNLALRNGYDTYEPAVGDVVAELPFRPTEHVLEAGSTLRLTIEGVAFPVTGLAQPQPATFTLDGAGSALILPTLPLSDYEPVPLTARP